MRVETVLAALLGCAASCASPTSRAPDHAAAAVRGVPLIPRAAFGDPQRAAGSISPDGRWLAHVALEGGVPNVFVAPRSDPAGARALTHDTRRGVRAFRFAYDGRHLLYTQDVDGDENDRLFAVDLESGATRALTPAGARAELDNLSPDVPGSVLVNLNDRDPEHFDPVRIELASGVRTRLEENQHFAGYVSDARLELRIASARGEDGSKRWYLRRGGAWTEWSTVPPEDALTTGLGGFASDGATVHMVDSRGRDTAAVFALEPETGARRLLDEDPEVDLGLGIVHPRSSVMQAIAHEGLRTRWRVLDAALAPDFAALEALAPDGSLHVDARTLDDATWIVRTSSTAASERTFVYDRATRRAQPWFESQPSWSRLPLQPLRAAVIESRDGLRLPSCFMLPPGSDPDGDGVPREPLPLVLWVHGGPWDREAFGFKPLFQLYANRGYAVLAVNYRGSTGFGKAFVNAARREWGGRMNDDLVDAKRWAVERGLARADRVAVVGGSYGGYAVLAALTRTPREFACGIAVAAPSSLVTLIESIPPYWSATRTLYTTQLGDPATPSGLALLRERSPLEHVARIERPLLIAHGANDPRVKQREADQIVEALVARRIPVTYALFPDEGHGIERAANQEALSALTEEFLALHLGGRAEPPGAGFRDSSLQLPIGAELVPACARALTTSRSPQR